MKWSIQICLMICLAAYCWTACRSLIANLHMPGPQSIERCQSIKNKSKIPRTNPIKAHPMSQNFHCGGLLSLNQYLVPIVPHLSSAHSSHVQRPRSTQGRVGTRFSQKWQKVYQLAGSLSATFDKPCPFIVTDVCRWYREWDFQLRGYSLMGTPCSPITLPSDETIMPASETIEKQKKERHGKREQQILQVHVMITLLR